MADVSNKTVALLLVAVIAISLGGMLMTLTRLNNMGTGYVTWSNATGGYANFSINSSLSITFSQSAVQFGVGTVNQSYPVCILGTNGTPMNSTACIGFTLTGLGNISIENNGDIMANVSLNMSDNATTFIGGVNPSFQYQVVNSVTRPGCNNLTRTTMREVNGSEVSKSGQIVCKGLNSSDTADTILVPIYLALPWNTVSGQHKVTLVAIGCDDNSC